MLYEYTFTVKMKYNVFHEKYDITFFTTHIISLMYKQECNVTSR